MKPFWVKFEGRESACVEAADSEAALALATELTGKKAVSCQPIPYPASPQLNAGRCPPFCYTPQQCAGRSACPKDYACSN